jgi:hypothetical protein
MLWMYRMKGSLIVVGGGVLIPLQRNSRSSALQIRRRGDGFSCRRPPGVEGQSGGLLGLGSMDDAVATVTGGCRGGLAEESMLLA